MGGNYVLVSQHLGAIADSIKTILIEELGKDTAKGRGIKDIFDSIVRQ